MYGFHVSLHGSLEEITFRVKDALKQEGFGVLTEINAHNTIKEKLGIEIRPYRILGACNPKLAHEAITQEPDIGLLLPCNVLLRVEEDNSITVGFIDPIAMFSVVDNPQAKPLAAAVKQHLLRVRDALAQTA
jgi:uncharacterized protein (DUF302 family)